MATSIRVGTTTSDCSSHAGRIGRLAPQGVLGLLCWHKTRGVSSQICNTLPPGNSRVALPILQGGFVSPLRVALHARVSPHDQHTLAMPLHARQELTTRRGWTVIDARVAMGSGATAPPRCKECCMEISRVACARA